MWQQRLLRVIPPLWAGMSLAIAWIAAPALFATLERVQAGGVAGRMFALEAQISLIFGAALLILERHAADARAREQQGSRFSLNLALVFVAVFCVVLGYYGLQPLMHEARAGRGSYSFGLLHGASSAFYLVKALALLALAWRRAGA